MTKTKQFILKANKIHNNKFNYSSTHYITAKIKVKIICDIHGEFEMTPNNHLSGQGCPYCGGTKKLTKDIFIERSKIKHNNKYDYSLVKYNDNLKKVKIICPIHGEFEQIPESHMNGFGCVKCRGKWKLNNERFIKFSNEIHNNKYDYSMVNYKKSGSKVIIVCPVHGEFKQTPSNHLKGNSCPDCGGVKVPTTEEFISNAKLKHNNKYDYSLVKYKNANTKIKIICPKHGEFEQNTGNHIQGQGCPKCLGKYKTTVDIIKEFNLVHNFKYDYSLVKYINSN